MNLVTSLHQAPNEAPALIDVQRTVSFAQLSDTVRKGAAFLQNCGLEKGDAVVLLHPISITLYEILLSCFHAGLVVVLVDPARDASFVRECLERTSPEAFIGSPKAHLLRLKFRLPSLAIHTGRTWLPLAKKWRLWSEGIDPVVMEPEEK